MPFSAKTAKISRQLEREGYGPSITNKRKKGSASTGIVSDDSAIGADEGFEFFGEASNSHQSASVHGTDPIALGVNFLPFRFVKGKIV